MGILAVIGFALGVAWPKIAGVKLIPEAPRDEFRVPPSASVELVKGSASPPPATTGSSPATPSSESLEVSRAEIKSCQSERGKAEKSCGELDVDAILLPRILMLESCPERAGASGVLSLGVDLNFTTRQIEKVRSGVSTTLPDAVRDGLLKCAKKDFASVKLSSEKVPHAKYTIFYRVGFRLSGTETNAAALVKPASGEVLVRWPTALIRKEADRNSDVVLKVRSGATLRVTGRVGDWLLVEASENGQSKTGYIHGAAVGEVRADVLDQKP